MNNRFLGVLLLTMVFQVANAAVMKTQTLKIDPSNPQFVIKLQSNPSTGYSWQMGSFDKTRLTLKSHQYQAPKTQLVGAYGTEVWVFQVNPKAFGHNTNVPLNFVYERPWSKSPSDTKLNFTVNIP